MPLVSVVIATFNRPHFLKRAIESVLQQTFTDFEIVVVDDGSAVPVQEVVEQYRDARLRYIYQENSGLAASRNKGIFAARGEFIAFLDDDDILLPNKLYVPVEFLSNSPEIGVALGGYRVVDAEGKVLSEERPWIHHDPNDIRTWLFGCPAIPSAALVRRTWLELAGGFDPELRRVEDHDLWLRLCYAGCRIAYVKEVLCDYTLHWSNLSKYSESQHRYLLRVIEKIFSVPDLPQELRSIEPQVRSNAFLVSALRAYAAGDLQAARRDVIAAIQVDPSLMEEPDRFVGLVRNQALSATMPDPIAYTRNVFHDLETSFGILRDREKQALAQVAMSLAFNAHRIGDMAAVRKHLLQLLRYDRALLLQRGTLSIAAEALLGSRTAGWLRRLL